MVYPKADGDFGITETRGYCDNRTKDEIKIDVLSEILENLKKLNETVDDIKVWVNNYNL